MEYGVEEKVVTDIKLMLVHRALREGRKVVKVNDLKIKPLVALNK